MFRVSCIVKVARVVCAASVRYGVSRKRVCLARQYVGRAVPCRYGLRPSALAMPRRQDIGRRARLERQHVRTPRRCVSGCRCVSTQVRPSRYAQGGVSNAPRRACKKIRAVRLCSAVRCRMQCPMRCACAQSVSASVSAA